MAGRHHTKTTRRRHTEVDLPANLRPLPAQQRAHPFWLELCVAIIFSLGALFAVGSWVSHCPDPANGCSARPQVETASAPEPALPNSEIVEPSKVPIPADQNERAVLTHAFTPLPLSFEDRATRDFVLPPGRSMLDLATEPGRVALDDVVLIAVVQQNGVRHALVRLPNGRIIRLKQGDPLDGGTVAAISDDALYVLDADQQPRAWVLGG